MSWKRVEIFRGIGIENKAQLIIIYGRKIGKTEIIKQFIKGKKRFNICVLLKV
ncbi:hypothetical protein [Saccharolobus islandicus]|uniref:hypothetical protein n=1 Tax=Saccharolobus islandicus TaxID=43080 RepID=UPI000AF4B3BF|nr:hypothetical protein [Sulfolobus islandicus]